ncbi:YfhO family protein [Paludibacter jiangxiensis]|uniref:Membrane protein YfhO n=1 Tax=Paludibacter jiangxiensis TaxID=681398 RepID=A0A170YJ01_9BACT|nr:YfhO family protein [Paludibacter jiangxiensis]GAT61844.1 membrane protein YfhO [Paludibacter jiangxiensis]
MNKQLWSKAWPHMAAILFFIVISYVYFSPVIDGKVVVGHDNQTWAGMSKETTDFNGSHDSPTLWTNSMFGGMPTYQIAMDSPSTAVSFIYSFFTNFPRPVFYLILYLIGFYILLLSLRVNPWLSALGAIGFAFASYNFIIIVAGHSSKAITLAYMAPVIGSVVMSYRSNRWLGAILTAIFLALGIKSGHIQIVYYVMMLLGVFIVSELIYAILEKQIKSFLITSAGLLGAAIIAMGINATTLITTYEYGKYSMRGQSSDTAHSAQKSNGGLEKDYITQWSYGVGETMTLLMPDFYGGSSIGTLDENSNTGKKLSSLGADATQIMSTQKWPLYWGSQPSTSGPVYIGAIICFLFVLGLFLVDGKYKWWLLAGTVLSIMLAWGKNFGILTNFFIDYVPYYNKFRTVAMILIIAGYTMPIMAILALQALIKNNIDKAKLTKSLYWAAGITGGLCLLFWLIPSLAGNFVSPEDAQFSGDYSFLKTTLPLDRQAIMKADALRSLIFIVLAAGAIWVYAKNKLKAAHLYLIFAVLFIADMYPVAKRYLNDDNFVSKQTAQATKPTQADKFILQDKSDYRVLNLAVSPFNDASTSYFHKSIGGYHGAKLRSYQDLIDVQLIPEMQAISNVFQHAKTLTDVQAPLAKLSVLNMLNMKYLIYNPEAMPITNPYANGTQWFVKKIIPVENNSEALRKVGQIDTKNEALVEKAVATSLPATFAKDTTATITLKKYEPNDLVYSYKSNSDQVAIFSEIYYDKGWTAYVNGAQVPYFKANYLLRGIALKPGQYDVEFKFDPPSYSTGNTISYASSILLVLIVLGGGFFAWRRNTKDPKEAGKE